MSEKELLYLNDINSHVEVIINKINGINKKFANKDIYKELLKKNTEIKNSIVTILEELC